MKDDVLKRNKEITGNSYYEYWDFAVADEKLWYSSWKFNGLYSQNLENGKTEFVALFPNEAWNQTDLYRSVLLIGKELIFIPYCAQNINIFNLETQKFETFKIPDKEIMKKYMSTVLIEDKLYLFPSLAKKVLCFDLKKRTIIELKEFSELLKPLFKRNEQIFYQAGTVLLGDRIYLLIKDTNRLIEYNWKTRKLFYHEIVQKGIKLGGMAAYKDFLYIYSIGQNKILRWNPKSEEKNTLDCKIPDNDLQKKRPIIIIYNQNIYFYFFSENLLFEASIDSMEFGNPIALGEKNSIFFKKQIGKYLFFLPMHGYQLCRYDMEKKELQYLSSANWTEAKQNRQKSLLAAQKGLIYENEIIDAKDYLALVLQPENLLLESKERPDTGADIWKKLKTSG